MTDASSTVTVPTIFSAKRRIVREQRAIAASSRNDPARFVWDDAAEDVEERLGFLRYEPERVLLIGPAAQTLLPAVFANDAQVTLASDIDPERPYPATNSEQGYDFIACIGVLDGVNDLPGALIHMRQALTPNGLIIASFLGGASLLNLRGAMQAAEPERPAARMHPMVDPRAAPQLLQRAGWKDPVVDTHTLKVRYSTLDQLVHDLRDQGLGSTLADRAPDLNRAGLNRARAAFVKSAESDGKVTEDFDIITLTGRRSLVGT